MQGGITRLRVADEGFLVASMIERCPRAMMLRELVRNAVEAAATAPPGGRVVRIGSHAVDGVAKLSIWNAGRGMDADELVRMGDIASSIRKQHSLDRNFGMGAKVASLPSNRLGLRYRSCHAGRVFEMMLGYRDGVYGRIGLPDGSGGWSEVVETREGGLETGSDWTEVLLLGNRDGQDTVLDPYDGAPWMPPGWVAEELGYRFFRIEDEVEIRLDPAGTRFEPLSDRLSRATHHEAVALPDGLVLHYAHDASPGPVPGFCGLVHRDEIYDVQRGASWLHVSPVFGIPFGAETVSILVELPEGFAAVPDGYRQFLRYGGGSQNQMECRHFSALVHRHRPDWLLALIAARSPATAMPVSLYDELGLLLRSLRVPRRWRAVPDRVAEAEDLVAVKAAPDDAGPDDAGPGEGGTPEPDKFEAEPAPEILVLREPAEIAGRGIAERAGRYYPETHQLFLNGLYPAVVQTADMLLSEFATEPDQEAVRRLALVLSEQALAIRVARMLVFALSKQDRWSDHEIAVASSPLSLSLAADDIAAGLPALRDRMRAGLA